MATKTGVQRDGVNFIVHKFGSLDVITVPCVYPWFVSFPTDTHNVEEFVETTTIA